MIHLYPYQTREVRDLAWACFSPTLLRAQQLADDGHNVADCDLPLTPARQLWLEQLDRDATPLLEYLGGGQDRRLGIYFEQLWHFFLSRDPALELVAHNLAVRDGGRTLGEFDCIYRCRDRQRHYHLELAVKFYLGQPRHRTGEIASHWYQWLGPNTHDRLDRKVDRLFQHQIRLGDTPAGRARLASLGIPDPAREVCLKGRLFQPLGDSMPPPYGFNEQQSLGEWLPVDQLQDYLLGQTSQAYLILPRRQWLGAARNDQSADILDRNALAKRLHCHFSNGDRAHQVAVLSQYGSEIQRFFVTAAGWPMPAAQKGAG